MNFKAIVDKKSQHIWDKNVLQDEYLENILEHPIKIDFSNISSHQVQENFAFLRESISQLTASSRMVLGYGYDIYYKELNHRKLGRQKIPDYVVFSTRKDFLSYLKKEEDFGKFCVVAESILQVHIQLKNFLKRKISSVLEYEKQWPRLLQVCDYFLKHPKPNVYMRMLNIPQVDTKFVETYQTILAELLDELLPVEFVNKSEKSFLSRYFLKQEQPLIRFRWLDDKSPFFFTDLMVPLLELASQEIACDIVFITENKMNGICFPAVPRSIVIFGLGFGVNSLKQLTWLENKTVYYWGDIDTHGFAMLSQLRGFLPQVRSILMNQETLMQFRDYWVSEPSPCYQSLLYLTSEEEALYQVLCHNVYGENIRLEQERISYNTVMNHVGLLLDR